MKSFSKLTVAEKIFRKRSLTPFSAFLLAILCIAATVATFFWLARKSSPTTIEQLYNAAMTDTITVESDEIFPLVTLTKDSNMVSWRDDKVLLLTINRRPERYVPSASLTLPGDVWTFTDKEIADWYQHNKAGVTNWPLRLKQLIGVPAAGEYTHVSAFWVSPSDVHRPAYSTDVTSPNMPFVLPKDVGEEYTAWFNNNIIWSYFDSAYPWTRLGYTYDWAASCDEYGLSEFLVKLDSQVLVEYTDSIDDFIKRLEGAA